jgi:hypothetical protein
MDREQYERHEGDGSEKLRVWAAAMEFSIASLGGAPVLRMDSTVRTLVLISLFAALCAIVAFVLDQQFVAAVFAAQFAFAFIEALRRAR